WKAVDWESPISLSAPMGVVDNPYRARQKLLDIDLSDDPLIVFGAAGRGKTTFLRTLILSLAASHSPSDLHIQVLDFGRGGMKALRDLPHIGGIVDANEEERVERLMRMVRHTIDERQRRLQAYDSLEEYNAANPKATFPIVLIVIDNVSEFKETYDEYLLDLVNLIRDGRTFGVYFAVSAPLLGDVPSKLFNVLGQRLTFTQVDPHDYTSIVGRGWVRINDEPGRGLTVETLEGRPQPLEFHTAIPGGEQEGDIYRDVAQRMAGAWQMLVEETPALAATRAKSVEILAEEIELKRVLTPLGKGPDPKAVPLGINDLDREPTLIELQAKGPHWLVVGPPMTGKTTTLRSLVLSLAQSYSPDQLAMILVDPSDAARRFFDFGSGEGKSLEDLPNVLATVSDATQLDEVVKRLHAEFTEPVRAILKGKSNGYKPQDNSKRAVMVIFDHYDDADLLSSSGLGTQGLSEVGKGQNLHFVIGGSLDIMRDSSDKLRRRAESSRYTLVLQDYEAVRFMGVRGNFTVNKELPPGRGFLVKAVAASMTQICLPVMEGLDGTSPDQQLGSMIDSIKKKYPKAAQWSYPGSDLAVLEAAIRAGVGAADGSAPPISSTVATDAGDALAELEKLMAEQSAVEIDEIPEAGDFAKVSVGGKERSKPKAKPKSAKAKAKKKKK
ncbi:MAG: FtsK/SpoIIIE domain-containing protein, partial [Anaerolineales bacterium]